MNILLNEAQRLAAQVGPVFPCRVKGKNPLTPHGFNDAVVDVSIITKWWTDYPQANIGLRTGAASGVFVVDLDIDPAKEKDGVRIWKVIEGENGSAPKTRTVSTPRGGKHLYFRQPTGAKIQSKADVLGPGIGRSRRRRICHSAALHRRKRPVLSA